MTALAVAVMLFAQTPADSTRTIKVRVLLGEKPAPAETEVRLMNPAPRGLCGTSLYYGAPKGNPDAQGWVTFEGVEKGAFIRAENPAYGSLGTGTEGDGPFTIRFPAGLPLRGRVVDGKGKPALRARVAVISSEGEHTLRLQAVNPKDGTFFFGNLAKGKWAVLADAFDDQWSQGLEVNAGDEKVEAKLTALSWISGQVLDTNGKPVPSARLEVRTVGLSERAFHQLEQPKTQAEYEAHLKPRADPVSFQRWAGVNEDGRFDIALATARPVEVMADSEELCANGKWVAVSPGKALDLRLPAPTKVKVKLVGANGAPLAKVTMSFEMPEHCSLEDEELETADGVLVREVPASISAVTFRAPGHQLVTKKLKAVNELDLGTVKFATGARLVGKLLDSDGKPLKFGPVYVAGEYLVNAKEDGTFIADWLKPGKAVISTVGDDEASVKKPVTLTAGAETSVELKLPKK
jgi:hypothetical protein